MTNEISEFLSKNQLFLSEYTNNIDKLFIDRICQDLLVKVRNIIKKDLHDSVRYEPQVVNHSYWDHNSISHRLSFIYLFINV